MSIWNIVAVALSVIVGIGAALWLQSVYRRGSPRTRTIMTTCVIGVLGIAGVIAVIGR